MNQHQLTTNDRDALPFLKYPIYLLPAGVHAQGQHGVPCDGG
jgi:hypothetical protein